MKKISSFLLCLFMVISFAACGSSGDGTTSKKTPTKVDSSLKKGEVATVGDVFKLPDVKQAAGAPVLSGLTKQAYPGDSIMVSGEGFKSAGVKFYVYSQSKKDNGKATEAKFTVADDNYASVLIDEKLDYGIYGIYAENASGTSAVKFVNKPKIWDIGLYKLTAGETLTVLGENLTTDNGDKSHAYLVSEDGKEYCEASIAFADPGKIEIVIPEGLKFGGKYKIKIHNGHGGSEGFAESEGTVEILGETAVQFNGKVIKVTDYGADPKSRSNDDAVAVQKAISAAKDGDIIYFAPGSYLLKSQIIITNKSLKLLGPGADKVTLYAGYNIEGDLFSIKGGPCEITGLCFEQHRKKGKIKGGFIEFQSDTFETGAYKLYVHGNKFYQSVSLPKMRSYDWSISAISTYGVIIENNYFDTAAMANFSGSNKVFFKNNEGLMNVYVGVYYHTSATLFTNVDFIDASNNKIWGKGTREDGTSGELQTDTFTAGRIFTVQGWSSNNYIAYNDVKRAGFKGSNAGEIILYENLAFLYDGTVEEAIQNGLTLVKNSKNKAVEGSVVSINGGKGRGQYRLITKRVGNKIEIDEPWDIIPDSTSHVTINRAFTNMFVCYNKLEGYENWGSDMSSTMGLQAYGSIHNMFYCQNDLKNLTHGMDITPYYSEKEATTDAKAVIAWNQIDRNNIENCGEGISMAMAVDDKNTSCPCEMSFGNVLRKNNIKNVSDYELRTWKGTGGIGMDIGMMPALRDGNWFTANLFESNTFKNCTAVNIKLSERQGKNIFRNNTEGGNSFAISVQSGCEGPIETAY